MTTEKKKSKDENVKETIKQEKEQVIEEEKSELEVRLDELEQENSNLTDSYQRLAAEFDNFRKRTIREKDAIYTNATSALIEAFLPVMDSMELAMQNLGKNDSGTARLKEGIENLYRQYREVLDKLDVELIECEGEQFDPELHHAVEHIEDENYGDNVVVEELMKGYIYKDRVIRHSLVKVAN